MSSRLVAAVYTQDENLFNGKKGPKPHTHSVAALALAQGMRDHAKLSDEYSACHMAIGVILMDLEQRGGTYPLSDKDHAFFELSRRAFLGHNAEIIMDLQAGTQASLGEIDDDLESRKRSIDERLASLRR
jgi:hypothetical protein